MLANKSPSLETLCALADAESALNDLTGLARVEARVALATGVIRATQAERAALAVAYGRAPTLATR
jgi:hypothetical protein